MSRLETLFGEHAEVLEDLDFQLLLLASIAYPMGSLYLSPIFESLIGVFDTTPGEIGLLMTAFYAPTLLITPVAGLLADRYGRKPVLVVGLLLIGVGGTAIALTTDFRIALALRFLQGVGAAGVLPVVITSIGDLYSETRETSAQGLRTTVHSSTGAVIPLIAGALVVVGWQYPFALYGVAVVFALVVLRWFEEPTTETASTPTSDGGESTPRLRELLEITADRKVLGVFLGFSVPLLLFTGFLTYASLIVVRALEGTPQQAALAVSTATISSATASSQVGRFESLFGTRLRLLVAGNLFMLVGMTTVGLTPSPLGVGVGAVFLGSGFGVTLSLYRSILTGLAPMHLRGGMVSIGETVRGVSTTATPFAMGILIDYATPALGLGASVRFTTVAVGLVGVTLGLVGISLSGGSPSYEGP